MKFFPWNVYRTDLSCCGSTKDLPVVALSGRSFVKVTSGGYFTKDHPLHAVTSSLAALRATSLA